MKKKLLLTTALTLGMFTAGNAQVESATMYKGVSNNPGTTGSYYGSNVTATGGYSFAGGYYSQATGGYSCALGVRTLATNTHAMSFGIDVRATGNRSITIGSGVNNGAANALINSIDRSLMVGFNSTVPTFFVGSSSGGTTTGNVGIANSAPTAKLDVTGDVHVSDRIGINVAPSSMARLQINTSSDMGIFATSTNWNSGVGADIRGGYRGIYGMAGVFVSGGTQPNSTYGVWGIAATGKDISCGVHGDGTGESTGYAYGVWGTALAGGIASYGVYGTGSPGFGPFYAGYFDGNVYTTGLYISSDERLKDNVKTLNASEKLMLIKPKEYTYRTQDFDRMNLPDGVQMGFIAQELEEVFPQLVKETVQPPKVDEEGEIIEEGITFKTVNYVGLIPVLTEAIQEQQQQIEELEARLEAFESGETSTSTSMQATATLHQNTPNPFSTQTTIRYSLPETYSTASILIFDMNGGLKTTLKAEVVSEGRVVLNANQLEPGMYIYSLVADDKEIASKRMIITAN